MNRDGSVTIGIVNRNKAEKEIKFDCDLFKKDIRVYEYDSHNVPYNEFADMQDYSVVLDRENATFALKPESVTYFTTDYIEKEKTVYAENLRINDSVCHGTMWNVKIIVITEYILVQKVISYHLKRIRLHRQWQTQ